MKTHHIVTLAFAFVTAVLPLHAADPVVTNVVSAQRAGTKLVDITFNVSDADSDTLSISVTISGDSGASFVVPVTALSGDTSVTATPTPTSKTLVWDASVDFNQQFNNSMVVRVIADDGSNPKAAPAGMVLIPAGPFEMGQVGVATPVHTVTVSAFYLDRFEVTKALWDDVATWAAANSYTDLPSGRGQGAFHPIHSMTWFEVVKWCNARSEKEGLTPVYYTSPTHSAGSVYRTGNDNLAANQVNWSANGYRLPTEAEWEKAARGTLVGKTFPWGNTPPGGSDANYFGSEDPFEAASGVNTTPVGYYDGGQIPAGPNRANGYGLYDMAGNVWEWCWDWNGAYPATSVTDPRGGTSASGGRVLRGGSWAESSYPLRCALRNSSDPVPDALGDYGFRTARGL